MDRRHPDLVGTLTSEHTVHKGRIQLMNLGYTEGGFFP